MSSAKEIGLSTSVSKKRRKPSWRDFVVCLLWPVSIFLMVAQLRLIALPSDEFPAILSLFFVFVLIPCIVITSYASMMDPKHKPSSIPVHILTFCVLYVVPALITTAVLNDIMPKEEIRNEYDKIIELSDKTTAASVSLDAELAYDRPLIFIWPFNKFEAYVAQIFTGDETTSEFISDCISNEAYHFYKGEVINCYDSTAEDEYKIRLKVEKLDFGIDEHAY